jgi:hypothetical protein
MQLQPEINLERGIAMKTTIIFVAVMCMPALALSATIYVPDDYPTIQGAIYAAVNGDTIIVRSGTYVENIKFIGKALTLQSEEGPEATIIDGNREKPVVRFNSGEGNGTVLDGFTITNGLGHMTPGLYCMGGGIYCKGTSPVIINCRIVNNFTDKEASNCFGAGIYISDGAPIVENNLISQNTAESTETVFGGGICCSNASPVIRNNVLTNNIARNYYDGGWANEAEGGGIACLEYSAPEITGNTFTENCAYFVNSGTKGASGGEIYCSWSSPTITGNTITGSFEPKPSGGIFCDVYSGASILENNISNCGRNGISCNESHPFIFGNVITQNAESGVACSSAAIISNNVISKNNDHGVWCWYGSFDHVVNNMIIDNYSSEDGGGIWITDSSPLIMNNFIAFNTSKLFGGGIGCFDSNITFMNNTVVGNDALYGGAFCFKEDCFYQSLCNTICWDNSAELGPEIYVGPSTTLTIGYSDVQGGMESVHVESSGLLKWLEGMIDSDPLFVDAGHGDFHLTFHSPCKDTGKTLVQILPEEDFEGDPRIAGGDADMGADEYHRHLYYTGEAIPGGLVEGKIIGPPGTEPVGIWFGSGMLENPLPCLWGWWHLKAPWILFGPLGAMPQNGVMIIPATLPADPPAPYDLYLQALTGNELTNPCIMKIRNSGAGNRSNRNPAEEASGFRIPHSFHLFPTRE